MLQLPKFWFPEAARVALGGIISVSLLRWRAAECDAILPSNICRELYEPLPLITWPELVVNVYGDIAASRTRVRLHELACLQKYKVSVNFLH